MVRLKKIFKNIWYIFELSYSFSRYYFFSIFFKIEDYIDYLEIVRFQLWHSSIANEVSLASKLKLKKKEHGKQIWTSRPVFTKIRNWFEPFSYTRGFAWDRGHDANNLESRLVQTEYLFHLERNSDWLSNFQIYSLANQPKRFYFSRRQVHGEDIKPGVSKLSQYIVGVRSVIASIYIFVFMIFFVIFLIFELSFLSFIWVGLRWSETFNQRFPKIVTFIKQTKFRYFSFFKTFFFSPIVFFFFKPIFYCMYICSVFIFAFIDVFKNVFFFIYSIISRQIFKIGFYFYKFYSWVKFRYLKKNVSPIHKFFYYINLIRSTVFSYFLSIYQLILPILYSPYMFILKHILRFIIFIIYWHIVSSIFFLFCYPTFVIITNFLALNFWLGYGAMLNSGYWVIFIMFVASHLIPYVRTFLKFPQAFRNGRYELTYATRKFISQINIKFYNCINLQLTSNKFKKWPLSKEVLALRTLEEEETIGLGTNKIKTVKDILTSTNKSNKDKFQFLVEHLFQLRENIATRHRIIFKEDGDLGDEQDDIASFVISGSRVPFKFYLREFQHVQFNIEQIYQKMSSQPNILLSVLPRLIYNSYINTNYNNNDAPYSNYNDHPNFVFFNNFFVLYVTRVSRFSKVYKNPNFFLQKSSNTSKSIIFTKFDSSIFGYMRKMANNQSSVNWNISLPNSSLNWARSNSKIFTFRATQSSTGLFKFNSIISDPFFNETIIKNIDQNDRVRYNYTSSYVQMLYDLYWSFHVRTNSFFSYSFTPEFYSESEFKIFNWLFKNSTTYFSVDFLYQDDFGSIINHITNASGLKNPSHVFTDALRRLGVYDKSNYYYFTIDRFNYALKYHSGYIDFNYKETYSLDFKNWIDSTDNVFFSVKDEIDQFIENYLYFETDLIDSPTVDFINYMNMPYRAQSAYSMYLHKTTAIGIKRYYITYKEQLQGIWVDLLGIFKSLFITVTAEDKVLLESSTIKLDKTMQYQVDKASKNQINTLNFIFRNFPIIQPDIIFRLYSVFVIVSFLQTMCLTGAGSEYWYIFFDFGLKYFTRNEGPFAGISKY